MDDVSSRSSISALRTSARPKWTATMSGGMDSGAPRTELLVFGGVGPRRGGHTIYSAPPHPLLYFAEDSETLVDVAASTMTDMFGARFRP